MSRIMSKSFIMVMILILLLGLKGNDVVSAENVEHTLDSDVLSTNASSWLSGWKYRKAHNLTGAQGAGIDYQVKILVNYGDGIDSGFSVYCDELCNVDFSDIRFTGSDQQTVLDYWIENMTPSDNAIIWLKIAENLDEAVTIYMYYGNHFATSLSNGIAVCDFFEDFTAPINTTKWNHTDPMPTFEEGIGTFTIESGKTWDFLSVVSTEELPRRGYRLRTRMRFNAFDDFTGRYSYFGFGYSNIGTYGINGLICIDIDDYDASLVFHSVGSDDFDFYGSIGDVNIEYKEYEILAQPMGTVKLGCGGDFVTGTLSYEIPFRPSVGIHVNGEYNANQITTRYDYFYVMKWVPNEPSHGAWGLMATSPYISDHIPPQVSSPSDINLEAGNFESYIHWTLVEQNPYLCQIYLDGVNVFEHPWEGSPMEMYLSTDDVALLLGEHNYTIVAIDSNLNSGSDQVNVIVSDTQAPIINEPSDLQIVEGSSTRIIWSITDALPLEYTVHRDSILIQSGPLQSPIIIVGLSSLEVGSYTFTITAFDSSGNNATDSVDVQVVTRMPSSDTDSNSNTHNPWLSFDLQMETVLMIGLGFAIIGAGCLLFRSSSSEDYIISNY
ncbi:MAG: DUF2341 domain-containing protein [Candidatus Thorarchaeota archaeon]